LTLTDKKMTGFGFKFSAPAYLIVFIIFYFEVENIEIIRC